MAFLSLLKLLELLFVWNAKKRVIVSIISPSRQFLNVIYDLHKDVNLRFDYYHLFICSDKTEWEGSPTKENCKMFTKVVFYQSTHTQSWHVYIQK